MNGYAPIFPLPPDDTHQMMQMGLQLGQSSRA